MGNPPEKCPCSIAILVFPSVSPFVSTIRVCLMGFYFQASTVNPHLHLSAVLSLYILYRCSPLGMATKPANQLDYVASVYPSNSIYVMKTSL